MNNNIDEEEETYPLMVDVEVDEIDQDDIKAFNKRMKTIERFIDKNKITAKNFKLKKKATIKETRDILKKLNLMITSGSYIKTESYAELLEDERMVRSGVLKSILAGLDVDDKIIVLRELLRELEGDLEPSEHYIG